MKMKRLIVLFATSAFLALSVAAQEAEDPFADAVETRHGLMLQMQNDLMKIGGMAKGETAYDAAIATKSAENIAAIASVLSMEQFPAGSEYEKSADSFALPDLWAKQDDFLAKIVDLNTAAAALKAGAGSDVDTMKSAIGGLGAACSACHKAYRQPEA